MINIPGNSAAIIKARDEFYDKLGILILDRLDESATSPKLISFLEGIENYLPKILKGKPNQLYRISLRINRQLAGAANQDLRDAIAYIFNYDWFTANTKERYNAYDLAQALDVNVCVYCNRNYTHTVIKDGNIKITRPTFDHFFNKAAHPVLAISFYNLVPSCAICNSGVKHDAAFNLTKHHHPYIDDYINDFVFSYKPDPKHRSKLKIIIKGASVKTRKTLKDLETAVIYNSHTQELKELLAMRDKFSDNYLKILSSKVLAGTKVTPDELYRIAFGTEIDAVNFGKRPFSKFKHDILKELGVIV